MKLIKKAGIEYYTINGLEEMQNQLLQQLAIVDEICRENNLSYWLDGGTLIGALRHGQPIPWDDDMDICVPKEDFDKLIPLIHERCKEDENRLLFFYPEDGNRLWAEYFGSLEMLVKAAPGWLPVRLDIAPMKTFPNTPEDIEKERKMCQMLTYCSTGFKVNQSQPTLSRKEKEDFRHYYYNEYADRLAMCSAQYKSDELCVNNFTRENTMQHHRYSDIFPLQEIEFSGLKVMIPAKPDQYLSYYDDWKTLPELQDRHPVNDGFIHNNKKLNKQSAINKIKRYYSKLDERMTWRGRLKEMVLLGLSHGPMPVIKRIKNALRRKSPIFR
jgi:lipopolysaccharide cholinephosphotransferase